MRLADSLVAELDVEEATTRRVLERVPEAYLDWRPHDKSSSLGQLALHLASLPQVATQFVAHEGVDFTTIDTRQPAPATHAELMMAFDVSLNAARAYLASLDDVRAGEVWRLLAGGNGGARGSSRSSDPQLPVQSSVPSSRAVARVLAAARRSAAIGVWTNG